MSESTSTEGSSDIEPSNAATNASSSSSDASTTEAATSAAEPPVDPAPGAAGAAPPLAADPLPPPEPAEPPIAPGVERLGRPQGTAQAIPETMLGPRPSPIFLAVVSIVSLVSDIGSKLWAEKKLADYPQYVTLIDNHLMFVLAKNKGGAWGLLQGESENVRRPFFLLVSVAAIAFIVTLYRRLQPRQYALKWGLPLVLGGALGNVFDRIRYGYVIDFIDYRADWIKKLNELVQKYYPKHVVTDHWPTFNVADIAICVGVALMAIDMLTSRRGKKIVVDADVPVEPLLVPATPEGPVLTQDAAVLADTSSAASTDAAAPNETTTTTSSAADTAEGHDAPPDGDATTDAAAAKET